MPQFEDIASFPSQLFWLLVCLVVLFVVVSRFAIPRLADIMEKRQKMIDDDLEQAERLQAQTESAIAVYEAALVEARTAAQASIRSVSEKSAQEAERRTSEVNSRLANQIREGEARINTLREQALSNIRSVAADVATGIVSRLAGLTSVPQARLEKAVEDAIKEN
ncbi:F0F1 ATP synthase subunit B' [Phaeovibrio sulfidiphilus]|uniref:ATP synthase subunit b n=1 Tax=Phaeovibrio sulfidiphilus TaxID=1220600 RepID=A0A8J6YL15_9PROT|nr:F0F1 ATP synthase subunit B' [Phaeovibrio sulfidiphilus]MBE1236448.1 F0F1 ATP synthase subunit B' [Phaeovibrio sulfidiphilus]